jgi:hypothetical protein
MMNTGANTTVGAGIQFAGVDGFIVGNYLWENAGGGGVDAGIFTLGISTSAQCLVSDNRIGIATEANAVSGGTADQSYVCNYEGTSGAIVAV